MSTLIWSHTGLQQTPALSYQSVMIKSVVRNRIFKFVINFIYQISTFRTIVKVFLIEIERTSSQSLRTQMLMFHMFIHIFIRVIHTKIQHAGIFISSLQIFDINIMDVIRENDCHDGDRQLLSVQTLPSSLFSLLPSRLLPPSPPHISICDGLSSRGRG